jgi:hypothetical protein
VKLPEQGMHSFQTCAVIGIVSGGCGIQQFTPTFTLAVGALMDDLKLTHMTPAC